MNKWAVNDTNRKTLMYWFWFLYYILSSKVVTFIDNLKCQHQRIESVKCYTVLLQASWMISRSSTNWKSLKVTDLASIMAVSK